MFSIRKTVYIIEKLIELTQHNRISWKSEKAVASMISENSRVDMTYVAKYIGRNIRISHQDFKDYLDDEKYIWDERMIVDFIDDRGNSLGSLPKTPNAHHLLQAIQFQNPQISSFYDDLFREQHNAISNENC